METEISNFLSNLEFGDIQEFEQMSVFPVFADLEGSVDYITLKEAMADGLLIISEVDEGGSVPELKVTNCAEVPVLLLDGEELVGAKQNRIINTSILLKELSDITIPVSCVEEGRWSYESESFTDSDNIASYNVRNKKSASVKRSVENYGCYSSDQGEVWNEVHNLQEKMECYSPTSALRDIYEAKEKDLNDYLNAFEPLSGQKGLLVFINGKIMGFDVLSSASAYNNLHKKLIKSYALDALVQKKNGGIKSDINSDKAIKFIKGVIKSDESKHKSVGYGFDYRFAGDSFIGSSLVYNGEVIHASFFRSVEIEENEVGGMLRFSQRANFRM